MQEETRGNIEIKERSMLNITHKDRRTTKDIDIISNVRK